MGAEKPHYPVKKSQAMLFACETLEEPISDHVALAGTPTVSYSSKPRIAIRKRHSARWALAEHEGTHRLCFVPIISIIWLMGLGFTCLSPRGFILQVWSRPHYTEGLPQYRTLSPEL